MDVALVCIAKNEDPYIEEWVNYNLKLGFDKVFIYENNWRCKLNNDNIVKIPFDGNTKQIDAYNDFIQKYSNRYQWAAFFDVDEFLVLKQDKNIKDFISNYIDYNGIGINWCIFGSNGIEKINNNYNVLSRFTKRQKEINQHIKTILKLNKSVFMMVHNPNVVIVDPNKNKITGPFNHKGDDKIAQLNHYFTKSKEEFELKINRGRADSPVNRTFNEFFHLDKNEIDDLNAYNFIYND